MPGQSLVLYESKPLELDYTLPPQLLLNVELKVYSPTWPETKSTILTHQNHRVSLSSIDASAQTGITKPLTNQQT